MPRAARCRAVHPSAGELFASHNWSYIGKLVISIGFDSGVLLVRVILPALRKRAKASVIAFIGSSGLDMSGPPVISGVLLASVVASVAAIKSRIMSSILLMRLYDPPVLLLRFREV